MESSKNRLSSEPSPYLQQHANNPVDWYPWNEESLKRARETGKPILLSIGYSACHWCHVMAHESFEDEETAALMNKHFINIKVDREERPDLDKIYQTTLQILTGKTGGWPLTMFITPDQHIPFFGGTYFAKKSGLGTPSFKQILKSVAEYYENHAAEIKDLSEKMQQILKQIASSAKSDDITVNGTSLTTANKQLIEITDPVHGGFGNAPKFPHTTYLEFLLREWIQSNSKGIQNTAAAQIVNLTLEKMALGGMYDQLGGGFFRYSVDASWSVPHFEKMLYDNALLLGIYSEAYAVTASPLYKKIIIETAEWVLREMQSPQGGYYSTINADSENQEGKFYYWDLEEIKSALNKDEFVIIEKYFGLNQPPNFEQYWHFHLTESINSIASSLNLSLNEAQLRLEAGLKKLLAVREKRIRPERDEKILTSWNALMIKGMTLAGLYMNRPDFIDSAIKALHFVINHLLKDGRLFASFKNRAYLMAYLDDYAFLLDAVLTLLQARWSNELLELAMTLAENLKNLFFDTEHGGFYFTAKDHESLIQRPKPFMDEAIPSGNAIAASALIKLGHLLGNTDYLEMAQLTLQTSRQTISRMPMIFCGMLLALQDYLNPPNVIILRGNDDAELKKWQRTFFQHYLPQHYLYTIPSAITNLPSALDKPTSSNEILAYFCQGQTCTVPFRSYEEFEQYVRKISTML